MTTLPRPRSSFELLWLSLVNRSDTATLEAVRAELAEEQANRMVARDQHLFATALNEIDGVLVARLAKRISDAAQRQDAPEPARRVGEDGL